MSISSGLLWPTLGFVGFWAAVALLIVIVVRRGRRGRSDASIDAAAGEDVTRPAPVVPPPWNVFAVVSLGLSFAVLLVPAIFAVVALVQIARNGERGAFLAIIAIAVQGFTLVGLAFYFYIGMTSPTPL